MHGSSSGALAITWLGHATFVLRTPGGVELGIDPWLTTHPACPDDWKQIRRADVVLVTHGHADHIADLLPVARQTGAAVVAIVEICRWLETKGLRRVHPMNKGGSLTLDGVAITMVHADHSAGWAEEDPPVYLGEPVGFVLGLENGQTVYVAGDTALSVTCGSSGRSMLQTSRCCRSGIGLRWARSRPRAPASGSACARSFRWTKAPSRS